jgi:hypothetical protein
VCKERDKIRHMEMATLELIIVKLHKIVPIFFRNLVKMKERMEGVRHVSSTWNMSSPNH